MRAMFLASPSRGLDSGTRRRQLIVAARAKPYFPGGYRAIARVLPMDYRKGVSARRRFPLTLPLSTRTPPVVTRGRHRGAQLGAS